MAGVFTIPAGLPFADSVARHLLETYARPDPLTLSRLTLLVPNRRAVGTMRNAFLRAGKGRVMLLPAIRSIADGAEEMPGLTGLPGFVPAVDGPVPLDNLQRRLHLARLICKWSEREEAPETLDLSQAFMLAADLAELIDELHTENIAPDTLLNAAPEDFADRWQVALGLLTIAIDDWPGEKKRLNVCDPAENRDRVLRSFAEALSIRPPDTPVIVAGSTGSIPSTAELMAVIARLDQGMVVLPGLDQELEAAAWQTVGSEHPQWAMKQLLETQMKIDRDAVLLWPGVSPEEARSPRQKLVSELLRPAATTERWHGDMDTSGYMSAEALDGITFIEAPGQREEAQIIALALRQTLETPGRSAALVTPDRTLADRVATSLRRWDIQIDDSGGTPLEATRRGGFLLLLAEAVERNFAPIQLLSVLKHPLAAGGMVADTFRHQVRGLERAILRGPRPGPGLDGILSALADKSNQQNSRSVSETRTARIEEARSFATHLTTLFAPISTLAGGREVPMMAAFTSLIDAAESLAATQEQSGAENLWSSQDGNAAFAIVQALAGAPDDQSLTTAGLVQVLRAAMTGVTVRAAFDLHPRIHIWGTPEARMQQTDLVILGGLNESAWPALPKVDIWLNRPMRLKAGLASPERRIGLSAHDFAQGLAAPEVMLTRSQKIDGAPQTAARWLFRLESLVEGIYGAERLSKLKNAPWLNWVNQLDRPERPSPQPLERPSPRPPRDARPNGLSVSRVETWIRDPYAHYAREILKLRPLDPIDQDPSHLERGVIVHRVFERFVAATREGMPPPDEATKLFAAVVEEELDQMREFPAAQAFWRERVLRAGAWFLDFEANRRDHWRPLALEVDGRHTLTSAKGEFILTAQADRIDQTGHGLAVLDYKTGQAPSAKEVKVGFAPQLPLEALMLQNSGFTGLLPTTVTDLAYIEIGGGATPGKFKPVAGPDIIEAIVERAASGLISRIDLFADESTPYPSRLYPQTSQQAGEYDHLARVKEWSVAGSGEDGE